jgi:serine kinase of HPr protein (carbohydrate metabolism regulator)
VATAPPVLHATLIACRLNGRWLGGRWLGGRWLGALVRGPSGAGKSDLALRALSQGWRLAADDRVRVWASGGALYGAAPTTLAGLLEVRGVGVVQVEPLPFARILLVADACGDGRPPERMPEPSFEMLLGVRLARMTLDLREPSAPAKLHLALEAAAAGSV